MKIQKKIWLLLPFLIYFCISWLFWGPKHIHEIKTALFTPSEDPETFVWFLNWLPFAIIHHLNPFVSRHIWYPHGLNLTWATAIPAVAGIMAPVTIRYGANVSFNIIALLAPALSAAACFYLVYFLTGKYFASLTSGYIYGFSSYELAHLLGHTNLYLTFLIPLVILLFISRVKAAIGRIFFIFLMSLALLLQMGISLEIFATLIFFSSIALLIFYLSSDKALRGKIYSVASDSVAAIIISLVVLSPYIYYILIGLKEVPGVINDPSYYSSDILNFFLPTPITRLGKSIFANIAEHYTGNYSENGAYLGLPMFLVLYYAAGSVEQKYKKSLIILFGFIVLCSLGPYLHVNGIKTNIPLLWILGARLPLLRHALPTRFTMYAFLIAAIIIGVWLSAESSAKKLAIKWLSVTAAIIFIFPNTAIFSWGEIHIPELFMKNKIRNYINKDENIVVLPYGPLGDSMYYQYVSGMWFTQSGGYAGFTPKDFLGSQTLFSGKPGKDFKVELEVFCAANNVAKIVYEPSTGKELISAINALEWPTIKAGESTLVTVPPVSSFHYVSITGDYWGGASEGPAWIGKQISVRTNNSRDVLLITGNGLPPSITGINLNIFNGQGVRTPMYIMNGKTYRLILPSTGVVNISSDTTWVPERVIHNDDSRELSVGVMIQNGW
jgi:hypothetical protein